MSVFVSVLIAGLSSGAIYAICALGFTLAYNSAGVLNMMQGAFVVLGGLLMYEGTQHWHLGPALSVVLAVAGATAVAGIFEFAVIRPNRSRLSQDSILLLMLGGFILAQGAEVLLWGSFSYTLHPFGNIYSFTVGGQDIPAQVVWIVIAAIAVVTGLAVLLSKSQFGRGLRALSENRSGATSIGLRTRSMALIAFAATGAIGGLAGAFVTPYLSMSTADAPNFTVLGIIAVTLGGFGSYFGAVIGGVVIGLVEAFASGYISSLFGESMMLALLLLILILRPQGLLRVRRTRRDSVMAGLRNVHFVERAPRPLALTALLVGIVAYVALPYLNVGNNLFYLNVAAITGIVLIGMDVLMGHIGVVSLGQPAFMAIGAYTTGLTAIHWGISPLLALVLGVVAAVVGAGIFSFVTRKLDSDQLTAASLVLVLLLSTLIGELGWTGGSSGLTGIPQLSVGGFAFDADWKFFYLVWAILGIVGVTTKWVLNGQLGRKMKAISYDPAAAAALGTDVRRYRHAAFLYAAALAGLAGGLYGMYLQYISPADVGLAMTFTLIVSTVVGGTGTILGPIIGGVIFTYLPLVSQGFAQWSTLVQGALIIVVLTAAPGGLLGTALNLLARARRRRAPGPEVPVKVPAGSVS
jgi:ABC-type branched-subunit amino acid transport system permease subunit